MTLASSIGSPGQRRAAWFAQAVLVLGATALLFSRDLTAHFGSLVPALVIAQLMTVYLLVTQSIQQRCPAIALLAAAYVVTAVSYNLAPYLPTSVALGTQMFPAFGIVAHVGFALCFFAYAFMEGYCSSREFNAGQYRVRLIAILCIAAVLPLIVTVVIALSYRAPGFSYTNASWIPIPITIIAYVAYSLRVTPTVTNIWMRVALLGDLIDALLVAFSPSGGLGRFGAQIFGLVTCAAMPTVYIIEFNWMYAKVTGDLQRQVLRDQLTDIGNRRRFDDHISRLCEATARGKLGHFAVLMLDIDDFKPYNDTYGHVEGDNCLRQIAKTAQRVLHRPGDEIARYGGEEFVVILQASGVEEAAVVAERIRKAIYELAVPHAVSSFGRITVSVGIAVSPEDGTDPEDLIDRADSALYASKRSGKNRVTRFSGMPTPL